MMHSLKVVVSIVVSLTVICSSRAPLLADGKKVALLVGVNDYDKRGFAEKPLQYAERDIDALALELRKQGFTVGVLKGSDTGRRRATKENFGAALKLLLKGRNASDVVLLGFAGHGQQMPLRDENARQLKDGRDREQEDAFFCPVDAIRGDPETMISLTSLLQTLDRKGGVNLVMVDACRDNPNPGRSVRSISGNELNGRLPSNTAIVFSCAAGQRAFETDQADGGHGVFFYHVLKGLRGEAADRRGVVTWGLLVNYVRTNVNDQAKEWFPDLARRAKGGRLQTPHALSNLIDTPVLARFGDSLTPSPKALETVINSIGMQLRLIPSGAFMMGSRESAEQIAVAFQSEASFVKDEHPRHQIEITKPYYLGMYEVTRGELARFVADQKYKTEAERDGRGGLGWDTESLKFVRSNKFSWRETGFVQNDRHPAVNVTWADAVAFCAWLSKKERRTYRLPTEAEWEYACRGNSTSRYQHGDDLEGIAAVGNVADAAAKKEWPNYRGYIAANDGHVFASAVGQFRANGFGLFDMHGNAFEWCQDWYDADYYAASPSKDPLGPKVGVYRVTRGGSWFYDGRVCRAANRNGNDPSYRDCDYGFRVVCELE